MAEYELLLTGIGGQGVQLGAQVVARAATLEGREVMFFGIYGGMMRGGNTDSTVVIAPRSVASHELASAIAVVRVRRETQSVCSSMPPRRQSQS